MKDIDYGSFPETSRQDMLRAIYKTATTMLKDPAVRARYEQWKIKRLASLPAGKEGKADGKSATMFGDFQSVHSSVGANQGGLGQVPRLD